MDTKLAKNSSSLGKQGMSISIRFNATDENLEEINTNPSSSNEDSSWRKDFLQGSFFNRKKSGDPDEGSDRSTVPPPTSTATDSGTTAWKMIKGKVNQAMEDIKSNRESSTTPLKVETSSHNLSTCSSVPLINGNDSDMETATIHSSFSDDFCDPIMIDAGPVLNAENSDSDNDVDSEIFNTDDTASILKRSFQSLKNKRFEKESLKAMLKSNKPNPKESPVKSGFLRRRKSEEKIETKEVKPKKEPVEIESGVEMMEDMVLIHDTSEPDVRDVPQPVASTNNQSPPSSLSSMEQLSVPNSLPLSSQMPDEDPPGLDFSHVTSALIAFFQSRHFAVSLIFISILCLASIPPFIQGVLFTVMLLFFVFAVYDGACAVVMGVISKTNPNGPAKGLFSIPDYKKMPICEIPAAEEHKSLKVYSGWMNEINNYDPNNCHISMTKTVFVKLDGTRMKVSNVSNRVPKRAIWNETLVDKKNIIVTRNRVFNLLNCRVEMCPKGLARKRYFNRKYPILLIIPNSSNTSAESSIATPAKDDGTPVKKELFTAGKQDSLDSSDSQFQDVDCDFGTTILNSDITTIQDNPDGGPTVLQKEATPCGDETRLLLFARTDRDKEDWYRRFLAASIGAVTDSDNHIPNIQVLTEEEVSAFRQSGFNWDSPVEEEKPKDAKSDTETSFDGLLMTTCSSRGPPNYVKFMSKYQQACFKVAKLPPIVVPLSSDKKSRREKKEDELWKGIDQSLFLGPATNVIWANILVGRVLFSCLNDPVLQEKIQDFLQKKLSAIKLPNFMEDVNIAQICLGDQPPLIHRISQPLLDERGTWIDADVTYEGLIHATVTTKLNLLRLKKQQQTYVNLENPNLGSHRAAKSPVKSSLAMSSIYDSDAESTGGSSSESESPTHTTAEIPPDSQNFYNTPSSSRKILRIVDRITASNLFQSATEISYVQRAMENMSTKITLRVELKGLVSRVTVNIPPPPSDRIWIGFRGPPRLWITAKPALGDHSVDWSIVTNVIENKLCEEVYKYLVFPNMVDVIAPFLGQSTYQE